MAIEEMFTSLPTVSNSMMSDIICAVQGYSSPSSLGLSTQQTLQQVYNLFQSNVILFNSGNPNGVVAGTTFQFLWDTAESILWICTTSGTASTAVWTRANINSGYATTATAASTTTLTVQSFYWQFFTGSTFQTVVMPVASTLAQGMTWSIVNNSTGSVTIQSSGLNTIVTLTAGEVALVTCILNSGNSAASWNANVSATGGGVTSITGTAHQVIASAATGAVTLSTPQNIDLTSSPTFNNLELTGGNILDANGNTALALTAVASAVNFVNIINNSTGNVPSINAAGSDTNIGLLIEGKGTGGIGFRTQNTTTPFNFYSGTSAQHVTNFEFANTANTRNVTFPDATGTIVLQDANNNISANNFLSGYTTTATAAGTTTLTVASTEQQFFTGSTTQTVVLPVTSTLVLGQSFTVVNNSSGVVTVQSSGLNTIIAMVGGTQAVFTCILTSGTTAASWNSAYSLNTVGVASITGTANQIIASASTGAVTLSTPQNINTTSSPTFAALTLTNPYIAGAGGLHSFQIFTSGSSATYTKPSNVTSILVEILGGGGGGGGVGTAASSAGAAGGGGGGGYSRLYIPSASATYTYTVGAGGTAGTAGNNNGGTGGTTTFSASSLQATGGTGGAGTAGSLSTAAAVAQGAAGGTGSNGNINTSGTPGSFGITSLGVVASGAGGSSYHGGGAPGLVNASGAGNAAPSYGGGGSGAAAGASTNNAGGAGASGLIIVWEFS